MINVLEHQKGCREEEIRVDDSSRRNKPAVMFMVVVVVVVIKKDGEGAQGGGGERCKSVDGVLCTQPGCFLHPPRAYDRLISLFNLPCLGSNSCSSLLAYIFPFYRLIQVLLKNTLLCSSILYSNKS